MSVHEPLITAALRLHHAEAEKSFDFRQAWYLFNTECAAYELAVAGKRTCTVGDCVRPHRAWGMCHMHLRLSREELGE